MFNYFWDIVDVKTVRLFVYCLCCFSLHMIILQILKGKICLSEVQIDGSEKKKKGVGGFQVGKRKVKD